MLQITSSPISHAPIGKDQYDLTLKAASWVTHGGEFDLDDDYYVSRFMGGLQERNYGRFSFERMPGDRSKYRIEAIVEGDSDSLIDIFEIDLDARPVAIRELIGERLQTTGRITSLRVHDLATGYGPSDDRIDGEVVVTLDSEPGRAFGFNLRTDNAAIGRQRLSLLRQAMKYNRRVKIDYDRTGLRNGTIVRAAELPADRMQFAKVMEI